MSLFGRDPDQEDQLIARFWADWDLLWSDEPPDGPLCARDDRQGHSDVQTDAEEPKP